MGRLAVLAVATLLALSAFASTTLAQDAPVSRPGDPSTLGAKPGEIILGPQEPTPGPTSQYLIAAEARLMRGVVNILTFPVDTIVCPTDTAMTFARRPRLITLARTPFSALQGAIQSSRRLVTGAVDVVTCLVPEKHLVDPPASYHCETEPRR